MRSPCSPKCGPRRHRKAELPLRRRRTRPWGTKQRLLPRRHLLHRCLYRSTLRQRVQGKLQARLVMAPRRRRRYRRHLRWLLLPPSPLDRPLLLRKRKGSRRNRVARIRPPDLETASTCASAERCLYLSLSLFPPTVTHLVAALPRRTVQRRASMVDMGGR